MPQDVRLWEIDNHDHLNECQPQSLDLEARLETWIEHDISVLASDLLVIGRQVETQFGGLIDLLCIDGIGDLVIVELKRDKTPREITAQALDYASWVKDLSSIAIADIAEKHLGGSPSFEDAFKEKFGEELPDSLNQNHRILIVASTIDTTSWRIIKYLSDTGGVNINAITFNYFGTNDGRKLLARVFLIDPQEIDYQTRTRSSSKRRPNLTYEELEDIAENNGVGDLYRRFVSGLEKQLQKQTTRSSIGFAATMGDSRKVVFSLIPKESDAEHGLHYQAYDKRLQRHFGISEEQFLKLLPKKRESWKFGEKADEDWRGYQGYFANIEEVNHFLKGLRGDVVS